MGGIESIIEENVKNTAKSFWSILPQPPSLSIDLTKYNQHFVNLSILVGAVTAVAGTCHLGKKAIKSIWPQKILSKVQLQQKYGVHSWALIADVRGNEDYCTYLADNGFNLILLGEEDDIKIVEDMVKSSNVQLEMIVIDWKESENHHKTYQDLVKKLQNYDISFLILPQIQKADEQEQTFNENIQPFQHIYLLVRYFGQLMKWRSYRSAIIFPSHPVIDDVTSQNGVTKALISGADAFGKIIGFELRQTMEVVVARGSALNAFKGLGKQRITY